ncbi:MAG: hypothetical protein KC421_14570 [Anaerolineales bacterium]|nr:hypothetical protein [Anaerolineales bacterium]
MSRTRKVLIVASALFVMFLVPGAALAQGSDSGTAAAASGDVAALLMPLVAAATAIERIIEMIFNWYESIILNAGKLFRQSTGYLKWAQDELDKARDAFGQAGDSTALEHAEVNLLQAEMRLQEYLKSSFYLSKKKYLTVLLGLGLGVAVAFMTQLQMLKLLGVQLNSTLAGVDMLVTGLIIGTGSAPVHSLIGLLQNTKDAVYEARSLWRGKSVQALGLRDEYADLMALKEQIAQGQAAESAAAMAADVPALDAEAAPAAQPAAAQAAVQAMSQEMASEMLKQRRMAQSYLR